MLVIVTLLLSALLLVMAQYYARSIDNRAQRRFYQLLEKNSGDGAIENSWVNGVVRRMGQGRLVRWLPKIEHPETIQLLKQAGWYSYRGRVLFHLAGLVVPALIMFIIIVYALLTQGGFNAESWAQLFIAGVLGYLLPKHLLRRAAKSRRNRLSREMPTAIHLLRMLFDAGLSTEHALRVLQKEGRLLTPDLSGELIAVLRQIDAGLDPADALSEMAAPLEVNELSDTVAILKQVSRHGGNIRETLVKFAQLMEERQLSALREYVNVLSGKMSVVMMVFLFPALLIFLAGPGFIALAKGLMTL
ncbi:type II secretion system F family protein [Methylophaga sp. OBS4]|uniref:type II secretion system F family protein n=1 Tax=Methylophaga sp. OBS4 TaxID=2991935 RepID=UPI00224EEE09|nr:type II secretion system F family protein [Methylophaga sp. OBS4]MCX4187523.1 type II secretion system F family protein [Methylophaga sp. OBS4]